MGQLPEGFLQQIARYPQLQGLECALQTPAEVSIRLNPGKIADTARIGGERVPWCDQGRYLREREQFTFDPKFHQGLYYVQDASSMSITTAIRRAIQSLADLDSNGGLRGIHYLDACAAPGGKTTAALSVLPEGSVVVANEYDYRRAEILAENISKWGAPNVVVSRGDTSKFAGLTDYFDIVAVDAPCSGEGMMRKEPQAIAQWSPALISQCAETQREILKNVWKALRPGGFLIYSTCTFNTLENEQNLLWIAEELGGEPINIPALDEDSSIVKGIDTPHPCYRFIPGRVRGEGLFVSLIRKPGKGTEHNFKSKAMRQPIDLPKKWFKEPVEPFAIGTELYAMPWAIAPFMANVASKLDVVSIGTHAATIKGKDVIPTHELTLSQLFSPGAFGSYETDYNQAIKYLQRDNITLPEGTPKGYITLTYCGTPLGIVKNLGNRSNTLMPKPWRILSQTVPSEPPT